MTTGCMWSEAIGHDHHAVHGGQHDMTCRAKMYQYPMVSCAGLGEP